jgi:crotonobetainyl-CoA:carnitine CoA-transferase CaiB-like acyl-CoA transferase
MCACIATLASIYGLQVNQKGQQIDISAQEALLGVMRHELSKYNNDWIESRATRAFPLGGLMQCKDGFVQIMPLEKHMWAGLMELMGNPEWSKEEKYDWDKLIEPFAKALPQRLEDQGKANDYLEQWALKHTREEIYKQGQAKGCAVGKVNTIEDLFRCRQLKSRNFFVEFEHPVVGKLPYPSTAIKYSKTPWRMERPAPLLGQHNEDVYCGILNFTREELVQLRQMGVI